MKRERFVYIVDSYYLLMTPNLPDELEELGLECRKSYKIVPAQNARAIMEKEEDGSCIADSEKLLVFMSTFFGDVEPAVTLSKQIKELNPRARIIFRSTLPPEGNVSFFDKDIRKKDDTTELLEIIENFLAE